MTRTAPKILLRLALGAASLPLALLALELGLRVAGYDPRARALAGRVQLVRASADPRRGYELVPGAHGEGWGTDVVVNAHGFRGPEQEPGAEGRTRIVALGDSVTFGNDLAYSETWPARLEQALRVAGQPADVLDLGLGGYDTLQEVAALEALGLAYRPARVVLAYCVNDVGIVTMSMETPFEPEDAKNPLYLSRIAQWWHVRSVERLQARALYERNREEAYAQAFAGEILPLDEDTDLLARVRALRAAVVAAPSADQDLATRRIPARWYASESRIGRLKYAFSRLAELADRDGFAVTLLLVPYLEDDPFIARGFELVRGLAESYAFEVVTADESFRAAGLAELRIRAEDPVHPNARGHELLARAILERWNAE